MNDIDRAYDVLLNRNYPEELFGDLKKFKKVGRQYMACCPFHDDSTPSLVIAIKKPLYYCQGCGAKGNWTHFIERRLGLSMAEAIEKLISDAGIIPDSNGSNGWHQRESLSSIFQKILDKCRDRLWTDDGGQALEYLKKQRGYTEDDIRAMGIGCNLPVSELMKHSESDLSAKAVQWLSGRDPSGIVIPYRDSMGRIQSLWLRKTTEDNDTGKYLPMHEDAHKDIPFNMETLRGEPRPVLVEGYFDALLATARGMRGVIATGGSHLTDSQTSELKKRRIRKIVLAFDGDDSGRKATAQTLERLAKEGIDCFVANMSDGKDPDDVIREQGIKAFQNIVEHADIGAVWKVRHILEKHDYTTDMGKNDAFNDAVEYLKDITNPLESGLARKELEEGLQLYGDELAPFIEDYRERSRREQERHDLESLFKEGSNRLAKGNVEGLREYVADNIARIKAQSVSQQIQPYTSQQMIKDIKQTPEGLKTGYKQLDEIAMIPNEAITIIAGRPSHGKTTLLQNLCLNMVEEYPDKSFLYLSYEETCKKLAVKFITMISKEKLNSKTNVAQIESYLKFERSSSGEVNRARQTLGDYLDVGRLLLLDDRLFVDDFYSVLASLKDRHALAAVFVDYIQKVKIKGKFGTRQVELQKISERILEAATGLSLPIILGAQFGRDKENRNKVRLDNLREAGDIEQDANLVIGLHNQTAEDAQHAGSDIPEAKTITPVEIDICLTILKNRNGRVGDGINLEFNLPTLRITDKDTASE